MLFSMKQPYSLVVVDAPVVVVVDGAAVVTGVDLKTIKIDSINFIALQKQKP